MMKEDLTKTTPQQALAYIDDLLQKVKKPALDRLEQRTVVGCVTLIKRALDDAEKLKEDKDGKDSR